MVFGTEPPAFSIGYEREKLWPGDSGFTVLFADAPDPDEVEGMEHPGISLVCLHCLIDDHPEIGRGLDIAREYGAADLEDGEWVAGDDGRGYNGPEHASCNRGAWTRCNTSREW
jgi:hypothetical protein